MVWYYVKNGARQGPVEEIELNSLVAQGVVRPDTLVWSEGMADWKPYSTIAPARVAAAPAAPDPIQPGGDISSAVQLQPDPVPEPIAQAVTAPVMAAAAAASAGAQAHFCTQCGRQYPSEELVRFGSVAVCANCKDIYAQRLRETGQVAGTRVYGGFWIRFLAVIIDGIIIGIVNFALSSGLNLRVTNPNPANIGLLLSMMGVGFTLSILLNMLYEAFFLVQYGATPGKMVLRLKVITPEGGGLTWGRAIGRHFAKYLSAITLMIGYIMAGFDSEKRALHDYIAGTRVIRLA